MRTLINPLVLWAASLTTGDIALGQEPQPVEKFDVVSVKANKTRSEMNDLSLAGGRLTIINFPLSIIISKAYQMDAEHILGPPWISSERYDISAIFSKTTSNAQVREMLKRCLFEKFQLKAHRESRPTSVYSLIVDSAGTRLKESMEHREVRIVKDSHGLSATNMNMTRLASMLSGVLHQEVVDNTTLRGEYDFRLLWNRNEFSGPLDDSRLPDASLFTALREQLGLRLEAKKQPVDVLVVDQASRVPQQ